MKIIFSNQTCVCITLFVFCRCTNPKGEEVSHYQELSTQEQLLKHFKSQAMFKYQKDGGGIIFYGKYIDLNADHAGFIPYNFVNAHVLKRFS